MSKGYFLMAISWCFIAYCLINVSWGLVELYQICVSKTRLFDFGYFIFFGVTTILSACIADSINDYIKKLK